MTPPIAIGDIVGGYRIERLLQTGGMATVYAAVHPAIGKRVAIKVLRPDLAADPSIVARFVQEARAVNCIAHPNVVDVFACGRDDCGRVFLAMELLEGESLLARMERAPLAIEETCAIANDIARALEATHASGIVHRDLKPDNVFLANIHGRCVVKLLDFGIAKDLASPDLTSPGLLLGTPMYIAPEQVRGGTISARTDVYALGVMLYEMLVGAPPFTAGSAADLLLAHMTAMPPTASTRAELPLVADVLVGGMLEKNPAARPSLGEVRNRLEQLRFAAERRHEVASAHARGEVWDDATELVARPPARLLGGPLLACALATTFGVMMFLAWPRPTPDASLPSPSILLAPSAPRVTATVRDDDEPADHVPMALPAPTSPRHVRAAAPHAASVPAKRPRSYRDREHRPRAAARDERLEAPPSPR